MNASLGTPQLLCFSHFDDEIVGTVFVQVCFNYFFLNKLCIVVDSSSRETGCQVNMSHIVVGASPW